MSGRERALTLILRICGALILTALFAVCLPTDWMAAIHRWIGLGELPRAPITEYLARSLSLFYAMHGGLLLVVSGRPRQYASVILYLGWAGVVFGVAMTAVDLFAPMPMRWVLSEGPGTVLLGGVIVWLVRGIDREGPASPPGT